MTDGHAPAGVPRAQRLRLGSELRRLRTLAGISGRDLARQVGIGQPTVSRIENAQTVPSLPQVRAWAQAVGASEDSRMTLIALTEAAVNEVESWRARQQAGLPAMQADMRELEATTGMLRCFQPAFIPAQMQTPDYARRVFALTDVTGGQDYAAAVAARMDRQQALHEPGHRFEFILTEVPLRLRIGPPHVMAAQLDRISVVATLANVEVRVIPLDADVHAVPWYGFDLFEDRRDEHGELEPFVMMETPHAGLTVSDPADVAIYRHQLDRLRRMALPAADTPELLRRVTGAISKPADQPQQPGRSNL